MTQIEPAGCSGCQGIGAHKRWCEKHVGRTAAMYGKWSEQCEHLADSIGANDTGAANYLYGAAGLLLSRANEAKARFQANPGVYR